MRPDKIDAKILASLMEDGRASFTQIAERTSLTTPTVSARVARMTKAGLIRKFVPLLSPEAVSQRVLALVTLKVDSASVERVASDLSKLPAVEDVYTTTGQSISLKVALESVQRLEPFLKKNILRKPGVSVASAQIVTSVVKEEPPSLLTDALTMDLRCDYCHGEVTSSRPRTISVGSSHYYFCCKTCRRDYIEKHRARLERAGMKSASLRS